MTPTGTMLDLGGGRLFDPCDPYGFRFRIEDIAGPLSRICRWGGRCSSFYSVAQHSLFVAERVALHDPTLRLHALMHDAAEAFLGDVPTPLKRCLRLGVWEFRFVEAHLDVAICEVFGLRDLKPREVEMIRWADMFALHTEARDLMGDPEWARGPSDLRQIEPMSPEDAHRAFLTAYHDARKELQ